MHNFMERSLWNLTRHMERAFYAEDLAKKDGLLQRIDPRVKIIGLLLLLIDTAVARNLTTIGLVFFACLVLAIFSKIPIKTLAARVWLAAFLFTGVIALPSLFITQGQVVFRLPFFDWPISLQGLRGAIFLVARVETAATLSMLLVLSTLWVRILKSLSTLRVPLVLIVILGMTYRYIFLLTSTAQTMFESRKSRHVGKLSSVDSRRLAAAGVGVLMTKSFHLSSEVFFAMQSRGFRGNVDTLDEFEFHKRDALAFGIVLTVAAILFWFASLRRGLFT